MSNCHIISYDMASGGDYGALHEAIKAYGTWARITESTWAIVTASDTVTVRDALARYLPRGSRVFVVESGKNAAWNNVICASEWLKGHL